MKPPIWYVIVVLSLSLSATALQAQSVQQANSATVLQTQKASVLTTDGFHATNGRSLTMSMSSVHSIARSAMFGEIASQLNTITSDAIGLKINSAFETIASGKPVTFTESLVNSHSRSISAQHTLSVKVTYDPRPIGGILNVRVALVPMFSGIGTASRPIASREVAQSVDNFDQDTVNQLVADLSHELASQIAEN